MQNYFNYYTEIEDHFQRRRGTLLMLSTLDWALIAAWQEAGFPLEAVLSGIDAAFDKHQARRSKGSARRINGLAYCAQAVLRAVEDMHEAATGALRPTSAETRESGFEATRIAAYLRTTADQLQGVQLESGAQPVFSAAAARLREFASALDTAATQQPVLTTESLEQHLVSLEDQLFATLQTCTPAEEFASLREQAARELAPHRGRLQAVQIRQIEQQFLRRSIFQKNGIPRLSLFYMRQT